MKAGQGARECPAWQDEPAADYVARLAAHLGLVVPGAVAVREMPRAQSYEDRLHDIRRKREPGEDG